MKSKTGLAVAMMSVCVLDVFASPPVVQWETNYNNWGWEKVLTLNNGLIRLSVVPAAGARILEYNLDGHPSLHITKDELGKIYEPTDDVKGGKDWRNYGGFRISLSPTEKASVTGQRFPPPVMLDTGPYEAEILENSPEQATLRVMSQIQDLPVPKWGGDKVGFIRAEKLLSSVRMERIMTIFPDSSRVRIQQTLINVGDTPARWGFKGTTQSRVRHGDERDYEQFWCYFPLNTNSVMGDSGIDYQIHGKKAEVQREKISKDEDLARLRDQTGPIPHWWGEVLPGVFGAHYSNRDSSGITADPPVGWVCYVDERDGYLYARLFEVSDQWTYGQSVDGDGARLMIYNSAFFGDGREYLELEVISPTADIAPNGGRHTFIEDWYAAKVHGPIYRINHQGAVASPLTLNRSAAGLVAGEYGVFHNGHVQAVVLDAAGKILHSTREIPVSPKETLRFREYVGMILPEAVRIELQLKNTHGKMIGLLDALDIARNTVE